METVCLDGVISADGKVRLEVPSRLPPGPVKVVVVLGREETEGPARKRRAGDFYGAAKDLNSPEDAQAFVNRLRDECER